MAITDRIKVWRYIMRKRERADYIAARLDEIYPKTPVPLDHGDNFQLLVAVLLSAQCTDERVNMVTPKLFSMADNPKDMATLKEADILSAIRTCGLAPKKSKAIKALSSILINDHSGEVPSSYSELESLPGVGHKTASVVMSQGFGYPAFPVDTHIHRLAQRWGLTKKNNNVVKTERDLKLIFPEDRWNKLHLQIIFYGREFCTARGCRGIKCEICRTCYPNRKKPYD